MDKRITTVFQNNDIIELNVVSVIYEFILDIKTAKKFSHLTE